MSASLADYSRRNVPRYTSYPTVPHFSEAIGAEDYEGWLSAIDPDEPVSLYVHVPYCRQLCWYCGCNMKLASRDAPIARYAAHLLDEIKLMDRLLPGRMSISHLAWGGGTPTALEPDCLARIMEAIGARFNFVPGAEISIESDPRTLTQEMIRRIGALGFTRASFGVQEFDPKVQAAINRIQPPEMVRETVASLRGVGVTGINFDLMYGLPHQTIDMLRKSIEICAEIRPDRIALFGYAHVPWVAKKQRLIDEAALPGAAERMEQAQEAQKMLVDVGYEPIGLDHFALPGDSMAVAAQEKQLRRNFQGYTTDRAETLIGFGSTSISRTPHGHVQNLSETGAWARAVSAGQLPVAKGIAFSENDRLRSAVIEAIMCNGVVDLAKMARAFGAPINWASDAGPELARMVRDGLIVCEGMEVRVSDAGSPLRRVVAAAFDAYLGAESARHSVAV
ncbi:MAG: oxygen-independent coproporphyrinogen III oxidase [Pseudomonadota bacterium]